MSDTVPSCNDGLRSDGERLMQCPKDVSKQLGWNWRTPIHEWEGVIIGENQRITQLNLIGCDIDP